MSVRLRAPPGSKSDINLLRKWQNNSLRVVPEGSYKKKKEGTKEMKQKLLIACLICMLGLSACSTKSDPEDQDTKTETQTENEPEEDSTESDPAADQASGQDSAPEESVEQSAQLEEESTENPLGFSVTFNSEYPNDVTGNWRLAMITEDIDIENYVLDYYNNYFTADKEVHIIINFARNTTTRINKFGNILYVTIMDYVDTEEHDAKLACTGNLLAEYHVDIESGEIEKIQ